MLLFYFTFNSGIKAVNALYEFNYLSCFILGLAGSGGEAEENLDDIAYIQNVNVGRKALDKAQYEQLAQQVESFMCNNNTISTNICE